MNVVGKWKDRWLDVETGGTDTTEGDFLWEPKVWNPNQIQNDCGVLLALLCKQDKNESNYGISYMACGSGEAGWDGTPPTQSYAQTTLTTEFYRQATWYYTGGEIPYFTNFFDYIDPITFAPSGSPTRAIEGELIVEAGDATGIHREFGLFGGNIATSSPDTGYMINWVVITAHNKTVGEELTRTIRLFLTEQ